jgi:hypothetical protein
MRFECALVNSSRVDSIPGSLCYERNRAVQMNRVLERTLASRRSPELSEKIGMLN